AGRARVELEPLVGFFVNMLPVRAGFDSDPSFRQLVARVREASLAAYAHQELPFDKLVEELQPRRAPGRNPIFQVVFLLQDMQPPPDFGEVIAPSNILASADAKFDLEAHLTDTPEGVRGSFVYSPELFDASTVSRMAEHYARLLERALSAPDAPLSALPLLGDAEYGRLVHEWNDTQAPIPALCLHEEFERQAARRPHAVALEFGEEQLTYAGLDARAEALARELRRRGVGPEVLVGVMLERSADLVVSLLAVSKAGGAYVPLNLTDPPARIRYVVEDAGVRVLLASRGVAAELYEGGPDVVFVGGGEEVAPAREEFSAGAAAAPDNLAYMMYTSGSTGEPKGVCVTHRNVMGLVKGADYAELGEGEVFLQFAPASFDASTFEIWACLLNGGRLVVFPAGTPSLRELGEFVNRAQVTTMWLTSGLFNQFVDESVGPLDSLRQLLTGGDVVSRPHVNRALEQFGDFRLINGYGPTESTTFACCHPVVEDQEAASVPIGRPISNRRVYVLSAGRPAGVGERGELYIGGAGLARGYHNRPELTAERFLPDPFATRPGQRLYRTGDLARYTDDGVVEFLGRADDQVKISGYRIEPGEIEAALLRHPSVAAAAVLVREFAPGDRRLAAYVVTGGDAHAPGAEELRGFLRERLPAYMVPGALAFLSELPLTANGKVDRRRLPDPAGLADGAASDFEPPRTQEEQLLAAIWTQVLGVERVGRSEDFFALGGHSLLAIRIVSRVRAAFRVELSVRSLFESPTVAGLAEAVRAAMRAGVEEAAPPPLPLSAPDDAPLSYAQQRLWFLDQLQPGGAEYNIPFGLRLTGGLNVAALEQSCGEIVRRHDSLRTNFAAREGQPVQIVNPARGLRLKVADLTRLRPSAREAAAGRLAEAEGRRPFDLSKDALLRVTLLRLGRDEHVLLVVMHHIVSDGWSIGVFSRELASLYRAFSRGGASPLAEGALRYADFAAWQRRWLGDERLAGQISYWREQLAGAPAVLELPTDRPRPAVQTFRGAVVPVSLAGAPTEGLRRLCREHAATPFMAMAAAFMLLLSRYSRQADVSVGTPVAGRTRLETEELIGLFVNTLVLRARLTAGLTLRGLLEQVREVTLQAHAHQDVPFEKLVDALQPERSLSYGPLFQVMFALQNTPAEGVEVEGLGLAEVEVEAGTAQFDLTLRMEERAGGFRGALNYNPDLFDRETAEQMARHFERLVGEFVRDAGQPAARVELLGAGERERLLVGFNATDRDYSGARRIHELFEEQAARAPEAEAVVCGGEALTYGTLNERANRIARRLRSLGVGPESVVGIYLERSADMVAALLGVLKAGGAYLPLDTQYPKQRVAFMLEDARPAALLTQSALKAELPETAAHVVCLDSDARELAREGADNPAAAGADSNLAYVIYTSGSTGRPKGVAIEHRSAVTLVRWAAEEFGAAALGRVLASTSICFDLSVFEIFAPLSCGGCVVLAAGSALDLLAGDGLAGTPFEGVTLVNTVPSAMTELARAGRVPASARVVNLAGEPLKRALADAVYASGPVERLYNLYGPSEDTTYSTVSLVGRGAAAEPTIGVPVANTRAYVLDAAMLPAPAGVPGELYLGGAGLARGYLGRPALTAERFVPDPFSPAPGGRLYKTGDLCRRRRDGELEFLGRADNQIKLRGFRIELGEIEAALAAFPGVRAAAAVVREDESGHKHLTGYVAADGEPRADELRAHLQTRLPSYMVPAALVWLDELPLSPNGKIDRKALPAPARAADAGRSAAPSTRAERLLASVWEEVLKVEGVGVGDNFFDLGGDSILSIHVAARARRAGLVLSPRQFFQHQTLGALARAAEEADAGADAVARGAGDEATRGAGTSDFSSVGLTRDEAAALLASTDIDDVEDIYPLSPYQQGLLFHVLDSPEAGIYLNQERYTLRGALDVAAFEDAYRALVERHQVLRTSVVLSKGGPLQVVHRGAKLPWEVYDWRALAPAEASARMEALLRDDYERGFDIASAPLMRATLVRTADDLYEFISTFHLLVMDGSSTPVMFRELLAFYRSRLTGEPADLDAPVRYGDYINWLRGQDQGEAEAYWREALAGFTAPTALGADRVPPPGADEQKGYGVRSLALDEEATAALRSYAARQKLTLNTLVQGAWALTLSRRGGADDVLFGGVVSGRAADFPGVESAVGVFLNTLPVRVRVPREGRVAPWLAALQAQQAEARRFEHCSLVSIQGWSEAPRGARLYDSVLVFQNIPLEYEQARSVGLEVADVCATERTHIPVALVAEPGARLNLRIVYQRSRFDDATVERILVNLRRLLSETAGDPDATFASLAAAVAAAERRALVESFSQDLAEL
ncbi:MAG TPA: amino acid adenylation domain-containing protein, partial [Pyrinomonadaceae bacterium]